MFELKGVLAITGKPGLYKVASQSSKSIVVETMDNIKKKSPVLPTEQVALLDEITIYTVDDEELRLSTILNEIKEKFGKEFPFSPKDDVKKLRTFFSEIAPTHDVDRVHNSDIQKVVKWYNILKEFGTEKKVEDKVESPEEITPQQEEKI